MSTLPSLVSISQDSIGFEGMDIGPIASAHLSAYAEVHDTPLIQLTIDYVRLQILFIYLTGPVL